MQNELDAKLIGEAIAGLDEILDRHAFGFVHLDRPALIERLERIRESTSRIARTGTSEVRGAGIVTTRVREIEKVRSGQEQLTTA